MFEELWNTTEIPDQKLRHLVQPEALAGDKAYYSTKIVGQLESEDVQAVIPQIGKNIHEQENPDFDPDIYRRRNVVERLIGWLKESRRVFSRFEKTAVNYIGMVHVACIRYYLAKLV